MARLAVVLAVLLAVLTAPLATAKDRAAWFSVWSRPQSVAVAAAADTLNGGRGPGPLVDQSVRNVVRLTGTGSSVRIRLSNRYGASLSPKGTTPLHLTSASVARRATGATVVASTVHGVTFAGKPDVTIAPGATMVSDPIALQVNKGGDLAVSLHVDLVPMAPQHGASFATSYVSPAGSGDHTRDVSGAAFTETTTATLLLSGVDVRSTALQGVIATTGGSVTDGFGTEVDSYTDYPSWLSKRVAGKAVVNNGLGGTTASSACAVPGTGPSVEQRVDHDSLSLAGVTDLIVYAGTNDLGDGCNAAQIIAAYRSIIRQAHARHVRVLITTITPRAAYSKAQNADRATVNAWVRKGGRCSGECDRSLDFDAVVKDPHQPNRIAPKLDTGDGIHPNGEGYRRIAASIPLDALSS